MNDDNKRAPKIGCKCEICKFLRRDDENIPVVIQRDPYIGVLKRRGDTN